MRRLPILAACLAIAAAPPADTPDAAVLRDLRGMDERLATVMYRLVTANAPLCRELQPGTGMVLHARDQYPADAEAAVRAVFGFPAPVAVELVVPGSPAAVAGMGVDSGVTAIGDAPVPAIGEEQSSATRDRAQAIIAALPPTAPITLATTAGARTIRPVAACRTAWEVMAGRNLLAQSDGRTIQITAASIDRLDEEQIAVTVSHELAHTILRHRARLEAAGVQWGFRAQFGRNARLFRETEDEADVLGAFLLRNAGWDPAAAVRFWEGPGDRMDGGIFRSPTHASARDRARSIAAALAAMPHDAPTPWAPPALLAKRDALLD